ncbi:nitronate monooxygenase [Mycobacteroides abscessus]|nr:nitronate monooxygenase [Mycobacteroides abscessus]MDM2014622.1 nitronate monooxygenase [Mycobacteroides abscessus]MDM2020263.1 nitronate monooxygenase [Mycobacteroides abscessus]MDM2023910.1 nitronate monooxygenase [Mycobacteroides abscessus]MDM2028819.1 nitronate monooxygenase [Mycobacteroides abscessus]MDM2032856.1 nitronate monooxygenase [Mycobacteroides abscessus]
MAIPDPWTDRLKLPVIAAPMTKISGPELVAAACRAGVIGSFPTHNAPSVDALDDWMNRIRLDAPRSLSAPVAPNLVVHRSNSRLDEDLDCLLRHRVELVITSVGSPAAVVDPLHSVGAEIYADVASLRHARAALDAGADGLVLLAAGAGGQTGWASPLAFVRAVREWFGGPLVLAGGISDGRAVLAAQALGADLAYIGTRFIATVESRADADYRQALIDSTMDDVRLSDRVGGIPASLLVAWLERQQAEDESGSDSRGFAQDRLLSNADAWSAGHSVSGIHALTTVEDLVAELACQYSDARAELTAQCASRA